jgi:hypothetical protein
MTSLDGKKKLRWLKNSMKVYDNTEKKNEQYKTKANKGRRQVIFEPGVWVWMHMRNEKISNP